MYIKLNDIISLRDTIQLGIRNTIKESSFEIIIITGKEFIGFRLKTHITLCSKIEGI